MVIWDEHGEVITALAEKISISKSVLTLETLEARRVVQFVQELGICNFKGNLQTSCVMLNNVVS